MRIDEIVARAASAVVVMLAFLGCQESTVQRGSQPPPAAASLTRQQVSDLTLLGLVWGFTKYHHSAVTSGAVDWDEALLEVMGEVLDSSEAATQVIDRWLAKLGEPPECVICAELPEDVHLLVELDWLDAEVLRAAGLDERLRRIYANRPTGRRQHYVEHTVGVGRPVFRNEKEYSTTPLPSRNHRILALYRFWNVIQYWYPYRDLISDWQDVLTAFIPRVWDTTTPAEYRLAMQAFAASIGDGHTGIFGVPSVRPPFGTSRLPVSLRFLGGRAVVTGYTDQRLGGATGLEVGDIIQALGGRPIDSLVMEVAPYYGASNDGARLLYIARSLTRGPPGPVIVTGMREDSVFTTLANRTAIRRQGIWRAPRISADAFRIIGDDVAYLVLASARASESASYVEKASRSGIFVIDLRSYPREFFVPSLVQHFVKQPTAIASITRADAMNPGVFFWGSPVVVTPAGPTYEGTVVILVNEATQSQGEYTAMAFRAAPNAFVAGSRTAGADGDVSTVVLPGGLRTLISGVGIFWPDRTPTQRVGILPDIPAFPTAEGIRQNRDEVLEAAVSKVLGRRFLLPRPEGSSPR